MELGASHGAKAFLIDGIHELPDGSLSPGDTVLISAGASAPEVVVQGCVDALVEKYGAEVESVVVREEHVSFPLPKELRLITVD
jgi:4-hydroxy-3-methylbut-2-enyl diphosphate reductase